MSAFRHLGRALLGARYSPEREFLLLACYLDEAGSQQEGFTVVAGFLSTVALWEQFEIDWRLMLASYNVPYFHMKEFSQSKKVFKKWKGAEGIRQRFSRDATAVIRQCVQYAVLCYAHHTIFNQLDKVYRLKETLFSPYAIAGRACEAQVGLLRKDVEFVFEDGGPDKAGLVSAMSVAHRLPDPIFKPSRDRKDKRGEIRKGVVQLQAADFLAYELRKYRQEFGIRPGRPVRQSFHEILKIPVLAMASFNGQNAVQVCQLDKPLTPRIVR